MRIQDPDPSFSSADPGSGSKSNVKCKTAYVGGILATTNFFLNIRALDILFMFLIVWYYCTLTIRESILIVNGSRIKVRFFTL